MNVHAYLVQHLGTVIAVAFVAAAFLFFLCLCGGPIVGSRSRFDTRRSSDLTRRKAKARRGQRVEIRDTRGWHW